MSPHGDNNRACASIVMRFMPFPIDFSTAYIGENSISTKFVLVSSSLTPFSILSLSISW